MAELKKRRVRLKSQACPECGQVETLKRIVYGLPSDDFDFDRYISGGCVVTGKDPEIGCAECGWEGMKQV